MAWPHYQDRVTVCDVLDSGACFDGVVEWIKDNDMVIAGETASHVANEYIARAAIADGYGYGYGNGNGDGNGYGNGYGNE
jgi:hypothetical protein